MAKLDFILDKQYKHTYIYLQIILYFTVSRMLGYIVRLVGVGRQSPLHTLLWTWDAFSPSKPSWSRV